MFSKTLLGLACLALAQAAPTSPDVSRLQRREEFWDASCDAKIPSDPQGRTYRQKAGQAFADASTMANTIFSNLKDGTTFRDSTAFSHYFDSPDFERVQSMLQTITQDNNPADDVVGYSFRVKCGSNQDKGNCGASVLAATNPRPGDAGQMVLCDRFFSQYTDQTKNDLGTKQYTNKRGGWCQDGEKFPFFEVAGLTILHEMTHLDIVGSKAGLTDRPEQDGDGQFMSHGTVDVYTQGSDNDMNHYEDMEPWQAARTLHQLWDTYNGDNTKYKPTTPAVENAESHAASALEFHFMVNCGWNSILL